MRKKGGTAVLIFGIALLISCRNDMAEVNRVITDESLMVETMRDVEVLYSDSAVVRVKMTGPVLKRRMVGQNVVEEFPEGIEMWFYNSAGRIDSDLRADSGIRNEKENRVTLRGNVIWKSREGDKLETEELIWLQKEALIVSSEFVTITRPEEVIYGYGFETDQHFTRWRILSPEGRIRIEE